MEKKEASNKKMLINLKTALNSVPFALISLRLLVAIGRQSKRRCFFSLLHRF